MTLQEAVDAVPADNSSPFVIDIAPGTYREKVVVDKPFVHFRGGDASTTRLVWGDSALTSRPDGTLLGTFESYTLLVTSDHFCAEGLTIENDAGPGSAVGQAVAASVEGDRAVFRRCRFLGHQDTLFMGPLPPFPLTAPSFGTAREHLPRRPLRQFYADCLIRGDIDFIFGSATAVFLRCEVFSNGGPETSWITAASTPEGTPHGYVFLECRLTSDARAGSVYLGRPWRDFARTEFWNCWMGQHVRPEGWHDWDKTAARFSSFYAEGGSTGPGAAGERAEWSHRLTGSAPTVAEVLGGRDGWNPE